MDELYALPEGWEWKKIGDTLVKTKNITPKNNPQSNFTYIDISSINNNTFSIISPKIILGKDAPSRAKKEVQVNDIVFATTRPNLKNIAIVKEKYNNPVASTGFCILRTNKIQNKYLFFYLLSNIFYKQVEKHIRGAQYPAISDRDVKSINIPLPPLHEQKRIVTKLDSLFTRIDRAIALHQQNIDEAEALIDAVLNEVFEELEAKYGLRKINTLFKIKSGDFLPKKKMNINGNINVYGGNGINGKHSQFNLIGENIIIGRVGALCGNVHYVYEKIWLTDNAFYISEYYEDTNKLFLTYMLKHIKLGNSANQAAQPVISYKSISNMQLPLPPLKTQQKTVHYLDQLSQKTQALKKVQQEKMQSLKNLKASILDKAFRGEL